MVTPHGPPADVASVVERVSKPAKAVVTAGMPYANGPLHLGHLAGALLPPDIHARYLGMLIGRENVLFVCGTDEHGSTSELAALQAGVTVRDFVDRVHDAQASTLARYGIGLDVYTGTSRPECFPQHRELSQDFVRRLYANGLLEKRTSRQWYDPSAQRFLPDRLVRGRCPNPKCTNEDAYSDECDVCGSTYTPDELRDPRSALSDATPELRETKHLFLDMWAVSETLRTWIQSKEKKWRPAVLAEVLKCVLPSIRFDRSKEPELKPLRAELPKHKIKQAPGDKTVLQLETKDDLVRARELLGKHGIETELADDWAHRSITRDTAWGIPLPDIDPDLAGKTLYVWPDSLIAPISFSKVALAAKGRAPEEYKDFWCNPDARVVQFLGQDNVFFYVLMQGAMWLGTQEDPHRLPLPGELQLTDVIGSCHLLVGGEKMSKSRGNFVTGDQLLDRGYDVDQIRYYLALLDLSEKPADFDFARLEERNRFLAGPLNAAFERPISAAHSKFGGVVPEGVLHEKVVKDTIRVVQQYVRAMERSSYVNLLFELENYARTVNSLFTQFKPHDDRHPLEGRRDALYTSFYVLKNLMIMLYPFVPQTMDRLRESLQLPPDVFRLSELGKPIPAGHVVGPKQPYFPSVPDAEAPPANA